MEDNVLQKIITYGISLNLSLRSMDQEGLVGVSDSDIIVFLVIFNVRDGSRLQLHDVRRFLGEIYVVHTVGFVIVPKVRRVR